MKTIDPQRFKIPAMGSPHIHRNLEWWATDNEQAIGVVILDLVDHDYSWVMLTTEDQDDEGDGLGLFRAVNLGHSLKTENEAREQLFAAMKQRGTT